MVAFLLVCYFIPTLKPQNLTYANKQALFLRWVAVIPDQLNANST